MWTLSEALERSLLRDDRVKLGVARAEYAADPENPETRDDFIEVEGTLRDRLCAMMAAGNAAGFGQVNTAAGKLVEIPAEAWIQARIEWERSALSFYPDDGDASSRERSALRDEARAIEAAASDGTAAQQAKAKARAEKIRAQELALGKRRLSERVDMVSVRVRPWLHLQDATARLAGLPLAVAFRRFVLDDPELIAIVDRASGCFWGEFSCCCGEVLDGFFTATECLWPAELKDYDLAVEWMDALHQRFANRRPADRRKALDWLAEQSDEDRAAFRIVRAAEAVVRDRVERFLAPLRNGDIVATAHLVGRATPAAISPAIWCRPTTRIDFVNGELFCASLGGPPQREWTGLMLSQPVAQNASPEAPKPSQRSRGGRPPLYPWQEAVELLAIRLMKKGEPDSGAALAVMMADCLEQKGVDLKKGPSLDDIEKHLRIHYPELWNSVKIGKPSKS